MMTEIDELEGKELAEAVALSRGWRQHRHNDNSHWWWKTGDGRLVCEVADYRPDLNIAQAWELDGERLFWRFGEHWWGLRTILETPDTHCRFSLDWCDFPTKAVAYATARCRAFLKAKAAQ